MNLGLVAILVLVPLLQVPAVLYLARFFEVEDPGPRMREFRSEPSVQQAREGDCRRCGASNDREFTYCRRCVSRLTT